MKKFLIISFLLLISGDLLAQHYLKIVYSEAMDSSIAKKENYAVFDSNMQEIEVLGAGIVPGVDSIAVIKIPFLDYKTNIIIRVTNVKDKAGNLINPEANSTWLYFDGFDPENEEQPYLIIKT